MVSVDQITWSKEAHPISDQYIADIEEQLAVHLPGDYKQIARQHHGQRPKPNLFYYSNEEGAAIAMRLGELFSLSPTPYGDIIEYYKIPPEGLPLGLLPIGRDGTGGFVCFDYREDTQMPSVVLWFVDEGDPTVTYTLSPTFTEFLEMLRSDTDD